MIATVNIPWRLLFRQWLAPAALVTALALILAASLWRDYQESLQTARQDTRQVTAIIAEYAARAFGETAIILHAVRRDLQLDSSLPVRVPNRLIKDRLRQQFLQLKQVDALIVLDRESRPKFMFGEKKAIGNLDKLDKLIDRLYRLQGPGLLIGRPVAVGEKSWVPMALAYARSDGTTEGTIIALIKTSHFSVFFEQLDKGANAVQTFLIANGILVARGGASSRLDPSKVAMVERQGTVEAGTDLPDDQWTLSYQQLPNGSIVVGSSRSHAEVLRALIERRKTDLIVVFLSLLAFLVVVGIASRHLMAREKTERQLRDVQTKLYQATSAMSEALVIYDEDDCLVLCNNKYRELYGTAAEAITPGAHLHDVVDAGRQFGVVFDEVGPEVDLAAQPDRGSDGPITIYESQGADGEWLRIAKRRTVEGLLISVYTDITSLKESEERFRSLVANIPSAVYLSDLAGTILLANEHFEPFFDVAPSDVIGMAVYEIFADDLAAFLTLNEDLVAKTGHPSEHEQEFDFGGGMPRNVVVTKFPVRGSEGQTIGIGTIVSDVTEQRAAEDRLRQAQKMDAIGQLTGGVAHDFNNLLAVVLGNAQLLQERLGPEDRLASAISKAAVSGAELTQRMLAFSRKQPLNPKTLAVGPLLVDMQDMLTRSLGTAIEVVTNIDPDTWDISADQSQVENAVLNLSINARDAMPKGGTLTISTNNLTFGQQQPAPGELAPGEYTCLSVSDSGTGMPPDVLQRVLEPFFTTKESGKGTGLGLSMVYGFVKQSGGHMEIDSEVGSGTTMRLYFPRASEMADADDVEDGEAEPKGNGEMVLLIECNDNVRELTQTFLEDLEYKVIPVRDAGEAYALLASGGFPFDVVLTEVQLPGGIDGVDVARKVQAEHPNIMMAFMSGGNDTLDDEDGAIKDTPRLRKPFLRGELAHAMRAALQQRGAAMRHTG